MIKFSGLNKIKVCVFISGTGSNLKNLIKFSFLKKSPIKISIVISNNPKAKGLIHARKYQIRNKIFRFRNKTDDEKKILNLLKSNDVKLVCLAGFMKILSRKFINTFDGKILNIHPSLLPKYKGLNTHQKALKNKEKYSGCTVHYVSPKLDSGRIILQKKVRIVKNETIKSLAKKIQNQEHKIYPKAILKIFSP